MDVDNVTVITGGLKAKDDAPDQESLDWVLAESAEKKVRARGESVEQRIMTILPGENPPALLRFSKGQQRTLTGRSPQARRFHMVAAADVIVSIEGGKAAGAVIELAFALERPILPLPFGSAKARSRLWWSNEETRCEIRRRFRIDDDTARRWEDVQLDKLTDPEVDGLAIEVARHVMFGFRRKCFVALPFALDDVYDGAIHPALESMDVDPIHAGRLDIPGNALEQLRRALDNADVAIANITGNNPNVFYEVGFAHRACVPVLLVCDRNGRSSVPFDLHSDRITFYENTPAGLAELAGTIQSQLKPLLSPRELRAS